MRQLAWDARLFCDLFFMSVPWELIADESLLFLDNRALVLKQEDIF